MQSKTSFFNKTVFRKDITRFAPVWGGYTFALLAALLLMLINGGDAREYWPVYHMADAPSLFALVNCGYGLLVAQLLFGDLYTSRSCYALHAMPLRRETWYVSHLASGLLFSLVPTLVMTLFALPIAVSSCITGGWQIPLGMFAACNMQFVFFFGLAVLSTFCAGSRLGMVCIYAILNLGSLLVGAALDLVCTPILFGFRFNMEPYTRLSPLASFTRFRLFEISGDYFTLHETWKKGAGALPFSMTFEYGEGWGYYGVCTLIGAALLAAGIQLYRKRQLECAGDFLAFPALSTVFTVIVAAAGAMMGKIAFSTFSNEQYFDYYLSMAAGLIVAWFAIQMLLERTTRVFNRKNFRGVALLTAAMAVAIGLVYLDPFGIETWVPNAEDVASIGFGEYFYDVPTLDSPQDIESILTLHRGGLEQRLDRENLRDGMSVLPEGVTEETARPEDYRYATRICLTYNLKNGRTASRTYMVWVDSEAGQIAKKHLSSLENATRYNSREFVLETAEELYIDNVLMPADSYSRQDFQSLWAAIEADCAEGNMARGHYFHTGYFQIAERDMGFLGQKEEAYEKPNLSLELQGNHNWFHVPVYADSVHTIEWLEQRGMLELLGINRVDTDYVYRRPAQG